MILRSSQILVTIAASFLGSAFYCAAHGDVHLQIVEITKRLEREKGDPELYLRRAELYRLHQYFDAALADLETAAQLNSQLEILDFSRGNILFEGGWPLSARVALNRHLARHTNHVEGYVTRSRVLHAVGERPAAVLDLTTAIRLSREPNPDIFIERAEVQAEEATNGLGLVTPAQADADPDGRGHRVRPNLGKEHK